MTYKDETSKYLDNSKMTIAEGAAKKPAAKKAKKRPFMSGSKDEKSDDMNAIASAAKGGQMLIKTLFPKQEPISVR